MEPGNPTGHAGVAPYEGIRQRLPHKQAVHCRRMSLSHSGPRDHDSRHRPSTIREITNAILLADR